MPSETKCADEALVRHATAFLPQGQQESRSGPPFPPPRGIILKDGDDIQVILVLGGR
jgi:hypothetical protein